MTRYNTPQNTTEQQAVIDSRGRLVAVDAFAGTGKTSTLVQYALARPNKRILYIAFNKSVAAEAKERFPDNVECRTTHSLAYAAVGRKFAEKLGNVPAYMVTQAFNVTTRRAKLALEAVGAFLCSTDDDISQDHVDEELVEANYLEAVAVVDLAKRLWEEMQNPRSPLKMPHDGYLKLWAQQKPRLRYDVILLDEAQDTNPITLDLVMAQSHATVVLVGDRHQGIYGFRKALNAMEAVDAEERIALTQSFRFGQRIADVATMLLRSFKGEQQTIKGRSDIDVRWSVDTQRHYALIGRTNAGLFAAAAHIVMGERNCRLHFVGGFDSYLFGKVLDAYYLWADERSKIKDPSISRFTSFTEFQEYGEEAGDAEVKALAKTVDEYRNQVPMIYNRMKAAETPLEDQAAITLTTGHRAKGLEWEQVSLADDFIELPPEDDFDPEEINLLYVAVTRAIRCVKLPSSLYGWLEANGFDFGSAEVRQPQQLQPVKPRLQTSSTEALVEAIEAAARRAGLIVEGEALDFDDLIRLCQQLGEGYRTPRLVA